MEASLIDFFRRTRSHCDQFRQCGMGNWVEPFSNSKVWCCSDMNIDENQLKALLQRPSEALQVELKTWLDPRNDDHIAKLIKAIFAIRNRNGGFIVIGFDDKTQLPDKLDLDTCVKQLYHTDKIQGLVSRYANDSFEVTVSLGNRDGQLHPVIVVPDGVRVPVIVKRDLNDNEGKNLLRKSDVYFRTLQSNGIPSSACITPSDYTDLLDICFENREVDIGRFIRRQLSGINSHIVETLLGVGSADPIQLNRKRAVALIKEGTKHAEVAAQKFNVTSELQNLQNYLTMRVGLVLDPAKADELPTKAFLVKVFASNPQYTGRPMWLDSRGFLKKDDRPYVSDGAWQALVVSLNENPWWNNVDFMRFDPKGEFYLQRVMQDDFKVNPGTAMDVVLMIYRVSEVLAVGLNIARNTGWDSDSTAYFAFQWTGLNERVLSSWARPMQWDVGGNGKSYDDVTQGFVHVPLEVSNSALAPYVAQAVGPLFALFDGYEPPQEIIENCVRKMIERKMDHN